MAAHAVTGLTQTIQEAKNGSASLFYSLRAALELSSWTEDLSLDGWSCLYAAVESRDAEQVQQVAEDLLVEMSEEWETLGKPKCREEWYQAKYLKKEDN